MIREFFERWQKKHRNMGRNKDAQRKRKKLEGNDRSLNETREGATKMLENRRDARTDNEDERTGKGISGCILALALQKYMYNMIQYYLCTIHIRTRPKQICRSKINTEIPQKIQRNTRKCFFFELRKENTKVNITSKWLLSFYSQQVFIVYMKRIWFICKQMPVILTPADITFSNFS